MLETGHSLSPPSGLRKRTQVAILSAVTLVGAAGALWLPGIFIGDAASTNAVGPTPTPTFASAFILTPDQLSAITVVPVEQRIFSEEITTEGKIGVDEYQATPVFSPYPGRVITIYARTGEQVKKGDRLFSLQANEMVQAQNDYLAALNALNKARSQLSLSQAAEKRLRDLYESRVTTLRELQSAQNDLTSATNDARTAEVGLEAVRNRLRILGLRDDEVANLQKGSINPETAINAPLSGTIIQRKIGPGQYVGGGGGDPSYIIGDLSKVWLIAQLREPDAARVALGDKIKFRVLAFPEQGLRRPDQLHRCLGRSGEPAHHGARRHRQCGEPAQAGDVCQRAHHQRAREPVAVGSPGRRGAGGRKGERLGAAGRQFGGEPPGKDGRHRRRQHRDPSRAHRRASA